MDSLKKPKAIFFDWDGTLVNSLPFLTKAHNHVKSLMGLPLFGDDRGFQHYLGMPRERVYNDIYGVERTPEAMKLFEAFLHE